MIIDNTIRLFIGRSTDIQIERASSQLDGYNLDYQREGDYCVVFCEEYSSAFIKKVEGELKAILGLLQSWD